MRQRSNVWCLVLGLAALGMAGCAAQGPWIWVWELPAQPAVVPKIKPGDTLSIVIRNQTTMSGQQVVQPNGTYVQPQLGAVMVGGMTEVEASRHLAKRLNEEGVLIKPQVNVSVAIPGNNRISVLGEVGSVGRVEVRPDDGMLELLSVVGGLSQFAGRNDIYLLRKGGKAPLRVRFDYDRLVVGDPDSLAFKLRDGDVVTVE